MSTLVATILLVVLVALIALVWSRSVRIIPQARRGSWSGSAGTTAR